MTRVTTRSLPLAYIPLFGILLASPADAVNRTCGANALSNTANVLCASPSGPCNSTSVTVGAPIDVTSGTCTFDLGGRALIVDRVFEIVATGVLKVTNAGDITITDTGALKSRGDYVTNPTAHGGTILLTSSGAVSLDGDLDVGGDPSGMIEVRASGNVTLESGSSIRGVGSSQDDTADGGTLTILSTSGSITIDGSIVLTGESDAQGGDIALQAARDIQVNTAMDASGGDGGGGSIDITAGDDIDIARHLQVDSRNGGGTGGDVTLAAGEDSLGGSAAGGSLTIDDATMEVGGSSGDSSGGDGGTFVASSHGALLVGPDALIRVNAGTSLDGSGGAIDLSSGDENRDAVGTTDGDLTIYGSLKAVSGSSGGLGGELTVLAGRDLTLDADLDLGGKDVGGTVDAEAGRTFTVASVVQADATSATGIGGIFDAKACDLSLTSTSKVLAPGEWGGLVQLTGRRQLVVSASSDVDASGWWSSIRLITRTFGTCSNASVRSCTSNADCVVGCNTGTCLNINPNTGGTTAQFDPPPEYVLNTGLATCP